ncbi:MAG: T9SS type A sorting domain-containing protein [Bacteroidia bacterium]|nr:T9SS type A sorting domain-containing protein [Bacteroidia bacterium]
MPRLIAYCVMFVFACSTAVNAQIVSEEHVCAEKARLQQLLSFRSNNTVFYGYNIHYNRCYWKVNPKVNGYLMGKVFAAFEMTSTADSIGFDLKASMQVDSVFRAGKRMLYSRKGDVLYVHKPGKWQAGTFDSVTIYYQGNPQLGSGFGYYVWDNHQTGPVIHTLSEPYGACFWWPCKQTLADKIDSIDLFISTVPDFKAAGNGVLISSDSINDSTRIFHWKHRYPIATYLVAFATTNYKEFTNYAHFNNRSDSLPVVNYVFPQFYTTAAEEVPEILPMLRLFDSLFGEYPFFKEKYGHAQFTWGGGMEHQTMSFMVDFSFGLMAHELAHQWFGDKVTCGSWSDLWLNEGFATYCTALCYKYLRPNEWLTQMENIRRAATNQQDGSIFIPDTTSVSRLFNGNLTYNKAAFVLHMLRIKLGDNVFYAALRKYLNQPGQKYGFAIESDLLAVMEAESGMDLKPFFLTWIRGEGYPNLQINWKQSGRNLTVTIDQTPSHPSVPFFNLNIPLRFRNNIRDTILYFNPSSISQTFQKILPFAADSAEFDPEVTVLAKASLGGINLDKINTGNFSIAPNPIERNELVIKSYFNIAEKVVVYNMAGQKVFETQPDFVHTVNSDIRIHSDNLGNGTYITRVYTKKGVTSLKFIRL